MVQVVPVLVRQFPLGEADDKAPAAGNLPRRWLDAAPHEPGSKLLIQGLFRILVKGLLDCT